MPPMSCPQLLGPQSSAPGSISTVMTVIPDVRLGWDLVLHPPQVQHAYWREQGKRWMLWDLQVVRGVWLLATICCIKHATAPAKVGPHAVVYIPAITILSVWWLLAKLWPSCYVKYRVPLVLVLKSVLALGVVHITNDSPRLLWKAHRGAPSPALLVFQSAMIGGVVHLPALCVGLALPFWLQLGWALARGAAFLLGFSARELVMFANTPLYLQGLDVFNSAWARLVQSGQCCLVSTAEQLSHHSAGMTLALLTMHASAVAVSMYIAYISQWIELRRWLQAKVSQTLPGRSWSINDLIDIDGFCVSRQQLLQVQKSHWAPLLLDGLGGVLGRASMVFLHAVIVGMLLLVLALISQVVVLQAWPVMLPRHLLEFFYPLRPGIGGDVCGLHDAPQFTGFLGSLMWALGPSW